MGRFVLAIVLAPVFWGAHADAAPLSNDWGRTSG